MIDLIKTIVHITIGVIFGFVIGIAVSVGGFLEVLGALPTPVSMGMFIFLGIGITFIIAYLRPDKIEQIRSEK